MASNQSFSLFPSMSIKKTGTKTKRSMPSLRLVTRQPDFEMIGMGVEEYQASKEYGNHNAAIGNIQRSVESPSSIVKPPNIHVAKHTCRLSTPPETQDDRPQPQAPSPRIYLPPSPPQSRPGTPQASGQCDGPPRATPMGANSSRSEAIAAPSPVMQSIFPRYDPSMPLTKHQYRPLSSRNLSAHVSIGASNTYAYPAPRLPYSQLNRNVTYSVNESSVLEPASRGLPGDSLSSPEALLDMWIISNGQSGREADTTFALNLKCDSLIHGAEEISLSSALQPVYKLVASANNALTISRTHPLDSAPVIQISDPTYTTPTAESPLMALIFPKLAELMAIDQSSSTSSTHRLDRQAAAELQSEAVSRAQSNEGSSLLWDSDSSKYFLVHPTMLDGTSTTLPIEIIRDERDQRIQMITISAPDTNSAISLLTLDLSNCTLRVNALPVSGLPSLYTLDTLVSALLILLLHLHRSTKPPSSASKDALSVAVASPRFPPPPTIASARSSRAFSQRSTRSTMVPWRTKSRMMKSMDSHDEEAAMESPVAKTKSTATACIVQPFEPMVNVDDDSLPKTTRLVVKAIYWTFEVLIWIVGLLVNLLAASVVGISKIVPKL